MLSRSQQQQQHSQKTVRDPLCAGNAQLLGDTTQKSLKIGEYLIQLGEGMGGNVRTLLKGMTSKEKGMQRDQDMQTTEKVLSN